MGKIKTVLFVLLPWAPLLISCEQVYDIATMQNSRSPSSLQAGQVESDGLGNPDIPGGSEGEIVPVIPDNPSDPGDIRCGNTGKHLMICHVPEGNPAARHTKCISVPGAVNGHGINPFNANQVGRHGGDTLGACRN